MRKWIQRKNRLRKNRAMRVRRRLHGTETRPRLSVVKSNCHIQVQLIDDTNARTMAGTATYAKEFRTTEFNKKSKASARKLGERIAEMAKEKNVKEVIFDRGSAKYHGILAELANAVREAGIQF